ncbi:MAG: beta-hydroxylase [Pirellulales bacterium]|nr:beta-hydroxylase [Pirellulales bacterium]
MSYLLDLAVRLAVAASRWPEDFRRPHTEYLLAAQRDDGGFAGRQGASDLYYTSFALRGLALLGALDEPVATRAGRFLRSRFEGELPGVDLYSLIFSVSLLDTACAANILTGDQWTTMAAAVDRHRHPSGGYAKSSNNPAGSTYHTFLAVSCGQLLGTARPPSESLAEWIVSRRRDDGGFVEIPQMRASGTNPTAAAVVLLSELGALDEQTREGAARLLASMQNEEGGFRANTQIPIADLLSTFTALAALGELNASALIDGQAAAEYAKRLQRPDGGFRGGTWDNAVDVEYTFYGLGTLALAGS